MAAAVDPATRKRVLKVVFISLLLDLVRVSVLTLCWWGWSALNRTLANS